MPKTLPSRLSECLHGQRVVSAYYADYETFEIRTIDRRIRMEIRTLRLYDRATSEFLGYLVPEIRVRRGFSLKTLNEKFIGEWAVRMSDERTVEFVGERVRVVVRDPWNASPIVREAYAFAVRRVLCSLRLTNALRGTTIASKESNRCYLKNNSDDIYRYDESTGLWSLYTGDSSSLKRIERVKRSFDSHDELRHLFVMKNVALDTRTGEFVIPKPELLCTRSTAYSYDPDLSAEFQSEMLLAFSRLFPVDEDREAFWRFVASAVRGDYPSDPLPVLTATGDGKDDLLCTVAYVMDYYAKCTVGGSEGDDIARLLYSFDSNVPNAVTFRLVSRFTTDPKERDAEAHVYPKYNLDYEPWASAIVDQIRARLRFGSDIFPTRF